MSGITSGVGIFSGIDSASLIEQLLAIDARPKTLAQARVAQLNLQQAAFLDISSRMTAVKNSAAGFRTNKTFQTKTANSSDTATLTATADTTASAGSYTFIVDRLVSTQQSLTRGFANKDISGVGLTTLSFEGAAARLDRDVQLSELNDGEGVSRGKILVTDSGGRAATVDLSRATTVGEVLEAINSNGTAQVTASVNNGKFVIKDNSGGTLSVANAQGSSTATSLGLTGGTVSGGELTGTMVYRLNGSTALASLNDGTGISIKKATTEDSYSFIINVGGASPLAVKVNLSDKYQSVDGATTKVAGEVADLNGVLTRINEALTASGATGVSASIDQTNGRLLLTDTTGTKPLTITEGTDTTASDLGLLESPSGGNILGKRVLAGMQSTLMRGLGGGNFGGSDGVLNFRLHNNAAFSTTIGTSASVAEALKQIEDASKVAGVKQVSATLDTRGTGIIITDLTSGSGKLHITGSVGADAAADLNISTGDDGVAGASVSSGNMQRKYMSRATKLSSLNNGRGVGTGEFRITDGFGTSSNIRLTDSVTTMGELIDLINSRGIKVKASINDNGDGLAISENLAVGEAAGTQKIKVEEVGGSVAKNLNILGQSNVLGGDNRVNGSFERSFTFSANDTLTKISDTINAAKIGISVGVVQDGSSSAPFRLSMSSGASGSAGRFLVDTGSFDLGVSTLDAGRDARIFLGSSDAARGVAVTSSTNTVDNILSGVKIDLKSVSAVPVNLTISNNTDGMESAVNTFISTFNTLISRIETQTKYDKDANKKAPLLGDGTALELRSQLFATIQSSSTGSTGTYSSLADVGVSVGTGGVLALDSTKFRNALATDPASVEALFTAKTSIADPTIDLGDGVTVRNPNAGATFSTLGVVGKIEQLAKRYVDGTDAILFSRNDQLRTQVTQQQDRIAAMDLRIQSKREILQRQFLNMEKAIGSLQSQQGALSSLSRTG